MKLTYSNNDRYEITMNKLVCAQGKVSLDFCDLQTIRKSITINFKIVFKKKLDD